MSEPAVFIIDDDPSSRRGLTRLVRAAGLRAESFASARAFLDSGRCDGPGCIVLDVMMPEMSGPELQEKLGQVQACMPIIFLSGHGDVPTAAKAMKQGALDFLTKPVDRDDLLRAIWDALDRDVQSRARRAESDAVRQYIESLTAREREVMTYVITGSLNKQIAADLGISEETVKVHRGRVMHKLGVVSVAELVRICDKAGIAPAERQGP
jgi:FixJ family two-component response regulator